MKRVPPCPRCGETDRVSRDAGCGICGWYAGSGDPPSWWAWVGVILAIGAACAGVLALLILVL